MSQSKSDGIIEIIGVFGRGNENSGGARRWWRLQGARGFVCTRFCQVVAAQKGGRSVAPGVTARPLDLWVIKRCLILDKYVQVFHSCTSYFFFRRHFESIRFIRPLIVLWIVVSVFMVVEGSSASRYWKKILLIIMAECLLY